MTVHIPNFSDAFRRNGKALCKPRFTPRRQRFLRSLLASPELLPLTYMDCTLCLKPERQYDAHYRYKMPALEVRADSRNKQRKTHLPNMASVAKNVFRPEAWLVKFLALHLSTDSSCSTGGADAYLTGHHGVKDLQQLIFAFVRDYVLCRCGSPETLLYVEGKKKNKVCRLKCHSCGRSGRSAGQDEKMLNLFAAQPMPPALCPMGSLDSAASGLDDVAMAAPATIDATGARRWRQLHGVPHCGWRR